MVRFKIETGIEPPRRGPKPKIAYDELFSVIPGMKQGDSIKITETTPSKRNSAYLTVTEVFGRRMEGVEGKRGIFRDGRKEYEIKTKKFSDDKVEVRVFRLA